MVGLAVVQATSHRASARNDTGELCFLVAEGEAIPTCELEIALRLGSGQASAQKPCLAMTKMKFLPPMDGAMRHGRLTMIDEIYIVQPIGDPNSLQKGLQAIVNE